MIKSSIDWQQHRQHLSTQIQALPYNQDLRKMLINIDNMVKALSCAEVDARRQHRDIDKLPEFQQVNAAIATLEQWIMMAVFLK
jgi:hypothetical protein